MSSNRSATASSSSNQQSKGVANFKRRTWNKEYYENLAISDDTFAPAGDESTALAKRGKESGGIVEGPTGVARVPGSKRAYLQKRDWTPDLAANLHKTKMVTDSSKTHAFQSKITGAVLKDSLSFLDHINGKRYNRGLGYSMRVERSSASDVRTRLSQLKRARENGPTTRRDIDEKLADYNARMKAREQEQERKKLQRKEQRENRKAEAESEISGGMDPDVAAAMGFSSFGSTKS